MTDSGTGETDTDMERRKSMGPGCPVVSPERLRKSRERLETSRAASPPGPVTPADILKALDDSQPEYFITTNLYWECNCPGGGFHRSAQMETCRDCEARRDDEPDSRINELRQAGIHLDLDAQDVVATLEGHGPGAGAPGRTAGAGQAG